MDIKPLTPIDADLRTYTWLKLDFMALFASPFYAKSKGQGEAFRAGVTLWGMSLWQLPAGSLPDDDMSLAGWAGVNAKQWAKIKAIVMGDWLLCSDGRFYHPMIAKQVNDILCNPAQEVGQSSKNKQPRKTKKTTNEISKVRADAAAASHAKRQANKVANLQNELQNDNLQIAKIANDELQIANELQSSMQMGGRGEDLDSELKQDLDLNQEVNTTTKVVSAPHPSKRVKNKKSQSNFSANEMILSCENLSNEVANDFINYRNAKKAPLTSSAWKTMVSEIQRSGMTPDNALSETMSAGWVGVKAEWLINRNAKQSPNVIPMSSRPKSPSQMTEDERQELRRKNAAAAKKILFGDDDFIDGVASHV